MSWDHGITIIWVGFLVIGGTLAAALFLWAVRSGQFGDQEHARSLPLLSGIPPEDPAEDNTGRPAS